MPLLQRALGEEQPSDVSVWGSGFASELARAPVAPTPY
jgi:hypothetical protein